MKQPKFRLGLILASIVLMAGLVTSAVHAATVVIINNDGAGEGFNDPTPAAPVGGNWGTTLGQQRLIAFQYAAELWGACLQSTVPITVRAQMDALSCTASSAILGSAGATGVFRDFPGAPLPLTWYNPALANALAGVDLDPATPDINATFNSNIGNAGCLTGTFWYYGLDSNPGANIDFVSVVVHEIGHGIGFQTFVNSAGSKLSGFDDQYMVFLENHGAVPAGYPAMSNAQRAAANLADPNLHWTGPLVTADGLALLTAGTSAGHVRMHGPNPYQSGSSVSHWSTALTPNQLMEPAYTGANHDPGLAWTLMDEIGWTLAPKVTEGCDGASLSLAPSSGSVLATGDDGQDRGVFVTAIKDFNLCSVGIEGHFIPGETLTANIYAASGNTRGALLATASTTVQFEGQRTHYIPISYLLQECKEYDIAVQWNHANSWPWWNENTITQRPYDIGGVIRVRDGEAFGSAGNFALPHFTLQGSSPAAANQTNLTATGNCIAWSTQHGAFVTPQRTISLCQLGIDATFSIAPNTLRAYVYESTGNVRGALVAEGEIAVGAVGFTSRYVPINAVLKEGQEYNIGFEFGQNIDRNCSLDAFPFAIGNILTVNAAERLGVLDPVNTRVPAFQIFWNEGPGAQQKDITGPFLGTPAGITNGAGIAFGKYVTALHNQELTSLGWYADLGPGQTLVARVYNATGTTRGTLVSQGSITTGPAGMSWHDIPLSASLVGGQNYDLEIDWTAVSTVNAFPYWVFVGGQQPYNAYGIMQVLIGEFGGVPDDAQECVQMRVGACATTVTGIKDGPTVTPKFALSQAYPNPFSGAAILDFELDEATTVSAAVYNVAGKKVADVMTSRLLPAGRAQLHLDGANLASGIYFVRLTTPTKSVSRKITIVR